MPTIIFFSVFIAFLFGYIPTAIAEAVVYFRKAEQGKLKICKKVFYISAVILGVYYTCLYIYYFIPISTEATTFVHTLFKIGVWSFGFPIAGLSIISFIIGSRLEEKLSKEEKDNNKEKKYIWYYRPGIFPFIFLGLSVSLLLAFTCFLIVNF